MIRTHWMQSASAAKAYYRQSDYYASTPGEWLGKGAALLGLSGEARAEDFDSLADNLHPQTGLPLTTHTREGRRVGLDMTFNSTKSVGIARELAGRDNAGDPAIEAAHREAVKYTMKLVEAEMQARVRAGGLNENRTTGNLVAYRVTHRDTRISAEDNRPDMSLHDHVFIFNATYDPVEQKWKAAEIGQIKHDAPYYESVYHNRLASNLRDLGYGVRRKDKAFEVAGVSDELVQKFSRRTKYIEGVAAKLGISKPESKSKLGATTRLGKAKELADDLNGYYVSRLTGEEKQQLGGLVGQVSYVSSEEKAVRFAIGHLFERQSVVEERKLYETAIRHGIGSVTPSGVEAEAKKQGVLLKDGQATTRDVLAEEGRIIDFAREGKGTMRPLVPTSAVQDQSATLSPEQQAKNHLPDVTKMVGLSAEQTAMVNHVLESTDQMVLVIGDAGTGKTRSIKAAFREIDRPIEMLAPSADASRGVLREEGFSKADTVASFLLSEKRQAAVRNGVLWIDEAGLLPIKDLSRLTEIARQQNARIVLQGDPKQHKSVLRHGNMMNVLQEYAGLPVGRLTEIWRQQHKGYKQVVADIAAGKGIAGFDKLNDLGWVKQVDGNTALVDDYMAARNAGKTTLVVAPTHAEGDEITAEIRNRMKKEGKLDNEERTLEQLVPLNWTEAERGDLERYDGTEVMQFHRNSGTFKAGDRVTVSQWKRGDRFSSPSHFSVYAKGEISLAAGDVLRFTSNGKTADGHKLNNGSVYQVKGFDKDGDIVLANGWTVRADYGHLTHGYVATSHASQGKTVDRVLIAMGSESLPAINADQFYVSVSRGRERATIYSDMTPAALREAIQRTDSRKSATELMTPLKPKRKSRVRSILKKARERFQRLRENVADVTRDIFKQREQAYAGQER